MGAAASAVALLWVGGWGAPWVDGSLRALACAQGESSPVVTPAAASTPGEAAAAPPTAADAAFPPSGGADEPVGLRPGELQVAPPAARQEVAPPGAHQEAAPRASHQEVAPRASLQGPHTPPPPAVYPGLEVPPRTVPHRSGWNPWDHPETHGGHTHDGFFLRLALGLGGSGLRGRRDPDTGGGVTFSGLGLAGSIAVGGALSENLLLHGDLFFVSMVDAEVRGGIYDSVARDYGYDYDGDVSYLAPGAGVTYYLMPVNVYFSGSLGLANAVWERSDGERQTSRLGLALNLLVGKEWWVDPQWGIGAAAQLLLMRADDYHYDAVQALSVGVLFSATHN